MRGKNLNYLVLSISCCIFITVFLIILLLPAIPQNPEYHNFSDQRTFYHIPHFWNVISNLPLIISGLFCYRTLRNNRSLCSSKKLYICYQLFFTAIFLIGIGSSYYHWQPSNETLFWDRLPMTIAFMAFFCIVIGESVSESIAYRLLGPLLLLGLLSVVYWYYTEKTSVGDLRFYALVQFFPLVIIPFILILKQTHYPQGKYIWLVLGIYFIAKLFESGDDFFFQTTGFISGHTLKHIITALAPCLLFYSIKITSITAKLKTCT